MIKNAKVLVTGGTGFIGRNLIEILIEFGYEVSSLDKEMPYDRVPFKTIRVDLARPNLDLNSVVGNFDQVFHLAAESHVDTSLEDPRLFVDSNVVGTYNILSACQVTGVPIHHVSTDEVFGDTDLSSNVLFDELSPYRPSSPYSATKAASDHLVSAWVRSFGVHATTSYCTNNFGPHQKREKFIPRLITNCLLGQPLEVYGDGSNIRNWLHVRDHCLGLISAAKSSAGSRYGFSSEHSYSNLQVAKLVCEVTGTPDSNIHFVADRKGHDLRYGLDSSKAHVDLNWYPESGDFQAELVKLVEWYSNNRWFWEP